MGEERKGWGPAEDAGMTGACLGGLGAGGCVLRHGPVGTPTALTTNGWGGRGMGDHKGPLRRTGLPRTGWAPDVGCAEDGRVGDADRRHEGCEGGRWITTGRGRSGTGAYASGAHNAGERAVWNRTLRRMGAGVWFDTGSFGRFRPSEEWRPARGGHTRELVVAAVDGNGYPQGAPLRGNGRLLRRVGDG